MVTTQQPAAEPERLARLEALVERLVEDMRELRQEMRDIRQEIRRLDDKIDRNFLWTMGVVITMWVTVILAILLRT